MPHTNNPNAAKRKANRLGDKPKFLQRKAQKPNPNKKKAPVEGEELDPDAPATDAAAPVVLEVPAVPAVKVPRSEKAALITEYHALEKQLATSTDALEKRMILNRQEELGGLQAYQEASLHGGDKVRGGESGKWCVNALKELKVGVEKKSKNPIKVLPEIMPDGTKVYPKIVRDKIRILDVGAIAGTSYEDWPFIEATCIDLNPQAPHVARYDFFDYPVPAPDKLFDVVGLSLVLNFVGSLTKRAEMLTHAHSYLKPSGLLYLVLPLPCLTNSRYMSHVRFTSILTTLGWTSVKQFDSPKLTYWLLRSNGPSNGDGRVWKREEVRAGVRRNNFCVIVGGKAGEEGEGEEEEEVAFDDDEVLGEVVAEDEDAEDDWQGCQ